MREGNNCLLYTSSATYGTDEILAEIVTLDRVKAFSKWAGDPEITFITKEQADRVGNKVGENTEAIVALKPDLVFVSTATPDSCLLYTSPGAATIILSNHNSPQVHLASLTAASNSS